ncbi:hypothetical protein D3C74_414850 [compost metagenome]
MVRASVVPTFQLSLVTLFFEYSLWKSMVNSGIPAASTLAKAGLSVWASPRITTMASGDWVIRFSTSETCFSSLASAWVAMTSPPSSLMRSWICW